MLLAALFATFLVLLVLIVIRPRYASTLASLACLVGAALVLIYLQDNDLQPWPDHRPANAARPLLPSPHR